MAAMPLEQEIEYPTSDGQPMAESTLHREVMQDTIQVLERRYADVPDVWVGGNLLLYYEQGNSSVRLAPDVLLAKGVSKWKRPSYLLWQETPPSLIVEVTSRSTRREDLGKKKNLYERIGVEEYVLFDPYGEYLKPRLQGYRLEGGRYQAIPLVYDSLESRTTNVMFRPEGERLRLVDASTGEPLLWSDELERARQKEAAARECAETQATEEKAARLALEERVNMLAENFDRWNRELREKGVQEGRQEGEALMLLQQLRWKFGSLAPKVEEQVRSADADQLLEWGKRVLSADLLEDVFKG